MHAKFLFFTVFFSILAGCAKTQAPAQLHEHGDKEHRESEKRRDKIRFAAETRAPGAATIDVQSYELSGEYDWQANRLRAKLLVRLTNTTPENKTVALNSK